MSNRKPRSGSVSNQSAEDAAMAGLGGTAEVLPETEEALPGETQPEREPREEKSDPRESETRDEAQEVEVQRASRIPMGSMMRLEAIAKPYMDPAFYLRFVIDKPGRLDTHLRAAYAFVTDSEGKHITFPSGSNFLHLMKLPIQFRKEDLEAKEQVNSAALANELSVGKEEYVPDDSEGVLAKTGEFDPYD